jgi:hypothetical protein
MIDHHTCILSSVVAAAIGVIVTHIFFYFRKK